MKYRKRLTYGIIGAAIGMALPHGFASLEAQPSQATPPTVNTGLDATVRGAVALSGYADLLEGGELRLREVVVAPGSKVRLHDHETRPAAAYVVEGELVEHRSDSEEPIVRRAGDPYFEGFGLVHWLENVSAKPARVVTAEIVPASPE